MIPEGFKPFGGGSAETALHPLALAILLVAVLLMWLLPRRYVVVPFLVAAIFVPLEQQLVVGGLHFMVLRLVLFCAWLRVAADVLRGHRLLSNGWAAVDKVFVAWVLAGVVTYTLLWADLGAFINRLGFLYNAFGIYFLLRHLLRGRDDVLHMVRAFAVICAVLAVLMTVEQFTGRNLMSIFGMPAEAEVRAGRIRSQASFAHSIIAGTCGAILLPMFVGLWSMGSKRPYAVLGVLAALVMVFTSTSSTPLAACGAAMVGLCFWVVRRHMKLVRWGVLGLLVSLHLVMKAPVWALIGRIDLTGGSTGWHRYALVDNFIRRFGEWWLIGTRDNANWGYDMWDSVNWYVAAGVTGGVVGLALFVAIIAVSFQAVGRLMKRRDEGASARLFAWCLGASLFAGSVAFIGISLFDQSIVLWYALLASIVTFTSAAKTALARVSKRSPASSREEPSWHARVPEQNAV